MGGRGGTGRTPRIVSEPDLVDAIVEGLELGLPVSITCETAGVPTHSFRVWMQRGAARALDGLHGDDDECEVCDVLEFACENWCPFVTFRQRVTRARANGAQDLITKIREKANEEKSGSRVLLELLTRLYPDMVYNPNARTNRRYIEGELLGRDPTAMRDDSEELELKQTSATIARVKAQTQLADAQRETLGRSGSYFDKLVVAVAGAVAGANTGGDEDMTQAELEAASPSAMLDGELD